MIDMTERDEGNGGANDQPKEEEEKDGDKDGDKGIEFI